MPSKEWPKDTLSRGQRDKATSSFWKVWSHLGVVGHPYEILHWEGKMQPHTPSTQTSQNESLL